MNDYRKEFISIIRKEEWLMKALVDVRSLNLPDWYIAAGAIRDTIWDVLHGFNEKTPLKDIDVVYFDSLDIGTEREKNSEKVLSEINPLLNWEVKNQARKSIKHRDINSSCESIAYWSETPTCVGIRLEKDNFLTICAPHGLSDLMELRVRPIPLPYRNLDLYKSRMQEKNWGKKWYKLRIE